MKPLHCIIDSFNEQRPGTNLMTQFDDFLFSYLDWVKSIEGDLFWYILQISYEYNKVFDYIVIVRLYHRFGKDVFKNELFDLCELYDNENLIDSKTKSLNEKGFDILLDRIHNADKPNSV